MTLRLDGKPLCLRPLSPTAERIRSLLDSLPATSLLTTAQLQQKIGAGETAVHRASKTLADYREPVNTNRGVSIYWGNPKAIAELRKELGRA
jgi:hypothetical protein